MSAGKQALAQYHVVSDGFGEFLVIRERTEKGDRTAEASVNISKTGLLWGLVGQYQALTALQGSAWPESLPLQQLDPLSAKRVCQAQQRVQHNQYTEQISLLEPGESPRCVCQLVPGGLLAVLHQGNEP